MTDPTATALAAFLDAHPITLTDWERRTHEAAFEHGMYPGESAAYDGDVHGRRADEACAVAENRWNAQREAAS